MKNNIKKILLLNSFFVFGQTMFLPLYAIYIQKIDQAVFHAGGVWSFYILSFGILTFFIRKHLNNKKFSVNYMILNYIIRIVGWVGYIFAFSIWHLYALQLLFAIGESFGTPSYDLLYSINLTKGKFASDWGLDKSITAFITAGGAFSGGVIVQYFGFITLFILMIVLSTFSIILALKYRKSLIKPRFFLFSR